MAAVGLNADIRAIFSKVGLKSLIVSLAAFAAAVIVFLFAMIII